VGYSSGPGGAQGVLWARSGAVQGLGTLPGSTYSRALAINKRGDVVGTAGSSPTTRAFLWTPSAGMKDLGMLPGDRESEAVHINDAGDVVGWSSGPDGSRAVLWSARGTIDRKSTRLNSSHYQPSRMP